MPIIPDVFHTGVLPPTHGEALIYGEAIGNPSGMDRVRAMMGVCPQFDVLWEELSGTEHLHIYAAIKGIKQADIKQEALGLMEKVRSACTEGICLFVPVRVFGCVIGLLFGALWRYTL